MLLGWLAASATFRRQRPLAVINPPLYDSRPPLIEPGGARSCPIVTPARSSLRTAASTGCVCRGSTRRASSPACSIGGGRVPPRSVRDQRPVRAALRAGTNVLETTWKTPSGWVVVLRRLVIVPALGPDTVSHTPVRPPTTMPGTCWSARRVLRRTGRVELVCEPVFVYGRTPAGWAWWRGRTTPPTPRGPTSRSACRPTWRSASRVIAQRPIGGLPSATSGRQSPRRAGRGWSGRRRRRRRSPRATRGSACRSAFRRPCRPGRRRRCRRRSAIVQP